VVACAGLRYQVNPKMFLNLASLRAKRSNLHNRIWNQLIIYIFKWNLKAFKIDVAVEEIISSGINLEVEI
jgi:hypothetical protein